MNTTLITADNQRLDSLATQINSATKAAEAGARAAITAALAAGNSLIEAKKLVPHGEWETWLTQNCEVAPRTAQAYMRLAKTLPLLDGAEAQRVADLPLREAMRAIATDPVCPPKPPYRQIRVTNRSAADAACSALNAGAQALKKAAKTIGYGVSMKAAQVAVLKNNLTAALAAVAHIEENYRE